MAEQQQEEIRIEDLELSLEVHEIESQERLKKLQKLFEDKGRVDPNKMFYEERSGLEVKFQNIVSDLSEFLIEQEIASTDKLRKTFYRILENPLIMLFKVSRFEIFNLRLNAFDIELDPIEAVSELGASVLANIEKHNETRKQVQKRYDGSGEYQSFAQFLDEAQRKLIQDQIFLLYSYLRKGGSIIKAKFEDRVRVADLYGRIQQALLKPSLAQNDVKTVRELSTLNYEIFLMDNSFDVLCLYLKVPMREAYQEVFKELQNLGQKAKTERNFCVFVLIFLRYSKEILAKLRAEGVDAVYAPYIQNALTSILQLWGCRLCYQQQFLDLFQLLLRLHPQPDQALELCLKHAPTLDKEDIVLLRVNYKHDIQEKHSDLLALLRSSSMQDINQSLSALYHQTLYNLDLGVFPRERVIELLTLLNNSNSLQELFGIVERAMKEWNHTIDFNHAHKYIEGEFKLPKISDQKKEQSFRLINNLCVLEEKNFEDYQALVKKGSIQLALLGLASFLLNNNECAKLTAGSQLARTLLANIVNFLSKALGAEGGQWQHLCETFSRRLDILEAAAERVIALMRTGLTVRSQELSVKAILGIYQHILAAEQQAKLSSKDTLASITQIFMKRTAKNNETVKNFALFGRKVTENIELSASEADFLKKNGVIKGDAIDFKDKACFILSELELTTNPVQFQRIMDNYYFTLDGNSKRYVQSLAASWVTNSSSVNYALISELIHSYPIALPLLCTTRVSVNNSSKRFVEALVTLITDRSLNILRLILASRCIRYKNGKDFIQDQVTPLVIKETIKSINEGSNKTEHLELLALGIQHSKCSELKLDLIQKSLQTLNFEINQAQSEEVVYRLSEAASTVLIAYFQKKQLDMRKQGLAELAKDMVWNDIRSKQPHLTSDKKKQIKKVVITDQILASPFAISQEFDIDDYKLEKVPDISPSKALDQQKIKILDLKNSLQRVEEGPSLKTTQRPTALKNADLSGFKFNLEDRLGHELDQLCLREGFKIVGTGSVDRPQTENVEQNMTLVQYYLKEFQNPEVSFDLILKYLKTLLENKIEFSKLFANFNNVHKLFSGLILLLGFSVGKTEQPANQGSISEQLLTVCAQDRAKSQKRVMELLAQIGYTNLWAETYNGLQSVAGFSELRQKAGFKKQDEEQTFFSWLLDLCLEDESVRQPLDQLLGRIFDTRPLDQNSLMYKVTISRKLLNSIMKSLSISHLSDVALLFHSNFNNLRLYTDQLHQGLKALGMSSKNRSFNEYIQLSKDIDDEEFYGPMKLFKENFAFFIRIEKQGYRFKLRQEQKLGRERVVKVLRGGATGQALHSELENVVTQFESELEKLQYNIGSRVKSFYLATKLRDFSYQNSLTVTLLSQILTERKLAPQEILSKINQVQIFSLMNQLERDLVRFSPDAPGVGFLWSDRLKAAKEVTLCTSRRYSHAISTVYQQCELEFDEVFQRCLDALKMFLRTPLGRQWAGQVGVFPSYLSQSFVSYEESNKLIKDTRDTINQGLKGGQAVVLKTDDNSFSQLARSLRQLTKQQILSVNRVQIEYSGRKFSLPDFLLPFKDALVKSQTLAKSKEGYLLFNKYKTSQKTLEELEIFGTLVGYCVFHNVPRDLPLHASIFAAMNFGMCDVDDVLDVDFKVWEDIRTVLSAAESKELQRTFSYLFESLETLKEERVELVDKGTSKKVNNLNRDEYCDLVCCHLLYKVRVKQFRRFLEGVVYACPKALLSSLSIRSMHDLFLAKCGNYSKQIIRRVMKKRGLVLPPSIEVKGKRIDNLKDYQSIHWLSEIMDENDKLHQSLWPDETNLFLCTTMSGDIHYDKASGVLLLGRVNSKQELASALSRL